MAPTPYQQTAINIISDSIKSAVFIDDRALEYFSTDTEEGFPEENLSKNLYRIFKDHGVSLSVHKFKPAHAKDKILKDYLFSKRDLVLLDWKLEGNSGEDKSLMLLQDVVNSPHIHFCAIYTSQNDLGNVFDNVISFFSGKTKEFYDEVNEQMKPFDELNEIVNKIDIYTSETISRIIPSLARENKPFLDALKEVTGTRDLKCALTYLKIATSASVKSEIANPEPEVVSKDSNTMVINNTIITILQKEEDTNPQQLIERLSLQVAQSKNSFTQLMGIEMQNVFAKQAAFVDSNLLKVSKETLAHHRKAMLTDGHSDLAFNQLMKSVLLEHASLSLDSSKLTILESGLMNSFIVEAPPKDDELGHINVFYNAVTLKSNKILNFGDVFVDSESNYYMCITALCDCFRPKKIKNIYYFVKGTNIERDRAFKLGDSAFVNFLDFNKCVVWSNIDQDNGDNSLDKYIPVYIKPISFHVKNYEFEDNKIEIRRIIYNEALDKNKKEVGEDIQFISVTYVTSIKPTYTQRIANHAFAHPLRVGVDFVKKEIPKKVVAAVVEEVKSAE